MALTTVPFFRAVVAQTPVAVLSWEKYGGTMLDADDFLTDFELRFRALVSGISIYKMRPANNDLLVSIEDEKSFFSVIRSASGANIKLEIGWIFEPNDRNWTAFGSCFIVFQLSKGCIDNRLRIFLDDLSIQKRA